MITYKSILQGIKDGEWQIIQYAGRPAFLSGVTIVDACDVWALDLDVRKAELKDKITGKRTKVEGSNDDRLRLFGYCFFHNQRKPSWIYENEESEELKLGKRAYELGLKEYNETMQDRQFLIKEGVLELIRKNSHLISPTDGGSDTDFTLVYLSITIHAWKEHGKPDWYRVRIDQGNCFPYSLNCEKDKKVIYEEMKMLCQKELREDSLIETLRLYNR